MKKLDAADLWSLEQYARERDAFRVAMIERRRRRRLQLGPHCTLSFEDRETIRYQVQEMLRAERIFEGAGIQEELAVYNVLIPDGHNLKATMLIEYQDPAVRARQLVLLRGIERTVWLSVAGHEPVTAIADEDLERDSGSKTSAVHFLRFELDAARIADLKAGAALGIGINHPQYLQRVDGIGGALRAALLSDFD
ncbi:MAG TPA: DUF3501 family protein [Steroidobacteraceae bacterium]|nr:DUF3501 family protein [Steroidobacteraceae bacterium]